MIEEDNRSLKKHIDPNIQADIEAVSNLPMVSTLLEVICRTTGMGFAAIARVTEDRWVACSVRDEISFGIEAGGELQLETTICNEIRQSGKPVIIDDVLKDVFFCEHHIPAMYGFQSYISVPIFRKDGNFFGTLCAIDSKPANVSSPAVTGMFNFFAELISNHLTTFDQLAETESDFLQNQRTLKLQEYYNKELAAANKELADTQRSLQLSVKQLTDSKDKQAMLAAIIESSEDAIISKTLDGIITSWNQSAENLFGHTENEAIGKHITLVIPEDRQKEERLIIEKIRNSQRIDHFETIRKTKSGAEIPISLTVSPIRNEEGQVIGASKIVRDISKQKQADEQLKNYAERLEILNSIGQTISAGLDTESILQKVTDATTQLTGASFGGFFHNQVNEKGESYMLYTLSGAPREAFEKFGMPRNTTVFASTFNGEGIVRVDDITKDPRYGKNPPYAGIPEGHLPVISYLAVPVTSKTGEIIGGLFFGHPEPAMFKKEHEQLVAGVAAQASVALDNAKLYEEVHVLNAKKDEFIGLASHELKTPVTSISGYLQIIKRNLSSDDRNKAFISKALQQVNKLTTLISDLLDVSKIQTGKLPLSYTQFDLVDMLTEVIEMMQQSYNSHKIELQYDMQPILLRADHQRMEQVIINLITNAVKYSPGTDKVIIKAAILGNKINVSVQDFGIGIAKNQQERIFSRFYRVENLAAHMSGLGIGLYICHEIISRHKGKMWVESKLGKGATFSFELPIG
ncbi:PAS domain S-box protein [Mucilaginibacter sp.]|uniref:PAS domain S-box protein n=1 Tax=Mucilaginibacter sp. TaxID=1882438 RepID=UPI0026078E1C|nr:PAS domain S-box protein [Mucilaginibacter sp.]MDB4924017.1 domain S-box protein [Mucilaginibacter sp.]